MDLYLGSLNPGQISNEIISNVKNFGVYTYIKYSKWLSEDGKHYKQIDLSDTSVWMLRLGNEKDRYIHIHPGRYSPFTMRVKATTLKTAIAVNVLAEGNKRKLSDLKHINEVRTLWLKLPPLKTLSSGTGKILTLINQDV